MSTVIEQIKQVLLDKLPELKFLLLFGSYDTAYQTAQSDIDLAVYAGSAIDSVELFKLQSMLSERFGIKVDLVDLAVANLFVGFDIVTQGRLVFCLDEQEFSHFYLKIVAMYYDLQITLRPYYEDIQKRGSVF